jgi:uncharacterized membrane protein
MVWMRALAYSAQHSLFGTIEPGSTYDVPEDMAWRWEQSHFATRVPAPRPAEPEAEAEVLDEDADLRTRVKQLHGDGWSQRQIADELGLSRTKVSSMLTQLARDAA